jgi:hypothetical protein
MVNVGKRDFRVGRVVRGGRMRRFSWRCFWRVVWVI